MVISALELFAYFIAWSLFYFAISHYIAKLSKDKWVDWAKSTESDEDLLIILDPIVNEIEDRMHEKLETFQASFYGPGSQQHSMTGYAANEGNWTMAGGSTAQGSNSELNDQLGRAADTRAAGDSIANGLNLTVLRPHF